MAVSTAPAAKAALLTILAARPALTNVTRTWAGPTRDEDFTGEMIFLGPVENDENWGTLGAGRRRETYRVAITVWVEQWGDDPQTTEERAWVIWGEITEALRADLRATPSTLRTAGIHHYDRITYRQQTGPATAEKWGASIDAQITLTATTV